MFRLARSLVLVFGLILWPSVSSVEAAPSRLVSIQFQSPLLSKFRGEPTFLRAQLLLPYSYDSDQTKRYPSIYLIHAFGERYELANKKRTSWEDAIHQAGTEFILVALDASLRTGHHEFADSANNGPWGKALTTELIPELDKHFRTIASPAARFVTGHSSGGWSALWLQINYPDEFGGAWASSPDPVDFHDFTGPDLTLVPAQNFYRDQNGHDYGFVKRFGADRMTLREYVRRDDEHPGGQFASFDAVFSPRGPDGRAPELFDHRTGTIDESVAKYWEEHYDIARILVGRWTELGPKLRGKLHVVVGTWDTFHLDGSLRLLKDELQNLGSDAEIVFAPHYDHFTIFDYDGGLLRHEVREMKQQLDRANLEPAR